MQVEPTSAPITAGRDPAIVDGMGDPAVKVAATITAKPATDPFYDRLALRAATIDELLSDDFESLPGQKQDADRAAQRLAAWCRACASGDWGLFHRRLQRDGLGFDHVLARFATVRRRPTRAAPRWIDDAMWIEAALGRDAAAGAPTTHPFEHLFLPVIEDAEARLWAGLDESCRLALNASARACLRDRLAAELAGLVAPTLYDRFDAARQASAKATASGAGEHEPLAVYDRFVRGMKTGGLRRLFEEKPVLLRLIAAIVRQWLATSRAFVTRLACDLPAIRRDILRSPSGGPVARLDGNLSDPHNGGQSVMVVTFESGERVVYKPKDLRLDVLWHAMVERLNAADTPIRLRAMRALARDGYGWTEFIPHEGCDDAQGCERFFERAGAWLALLHCFAATDMHHENMIASGENPVPIDLETILQPAADEHQAREPEAAAMEAAKDIVAHSVMSVGLVPSFGRSADNDVFAVGGMASDWAASTKLVWREVNTDTMRPQAEQIREKATPNLPRLGERYVRFGDHVDEFVAGFESYMGFLQRSETQAGLLEPFAGYPVRKVVRPTQFYHLLIGRLRDDRSMEDGVAWSVQADFLARLSDWNAADPLWSLHRAERAALIELNVPYFELPNDGLVVIGNVEPTQTVSGFELARARIRDLNEDAIAWQVDVIRQNACTLSTASDPDPRNAPARFEAAPSEESAAPASATLRAEADAIAEEIARHAVRRGASAAWIGLGWAADSEVSQLAVLGPELYNGACGIAVFLAAHAKVSGDPGSGELARAAVAHLRRSLAGRNAPRLVRSIGIGGATGLGSVAYAFAVMADLLRDPGLLADAEATVALFSDDLIAADKQLDVIGGAAGAILALLRVHRDTKSTAALERALRCGEHLLAQPRAGAPGRRSWATLGSETRALTGFSHGAAGFAYALASLAQASGRRDFAEAATECIAFENASYDAGNANWPDLREAEPHWHSQWCHGAVGIGLARVAMAKRQEPASEAIRADIHNALEGTARGWPGHVDTLCCGTLGSVEFLREAGTALAREDLCALAVKRLGDVLGSARAGGDYRWNYGARRFNLGLFRGLSGVGYTCLRQLDAELPNILIWE